MECIHVIRNTFKTCGDYKTFVESFTSAGYSPFDPKTLEPGDIDNAWDIMWIHKDAVKLAV